MTLPGVRRLDWDSRFFGFPAAAVDDPEIGDAALAEALGACRAEGIAFVTWHAARGRAAPAALCARFHGAFVGERLTYARGLGDAEAVTLVASPAPAAPRVRVVEHQKSAAEPALVELALLSGTLSRFRVDPRVPPGKFEELYRAWIERSCRGEIADAVLVAGNPGGGTAGLLTLALAGGVAKIGLVAVEPACQGRGVGRALMDAAHAFMRARGAARAEVVTQGANAAAAALYGSSGYALVDARATHHFWPTDA